MEKISCIENLAKKLKQGWKLKSFKYPIAEIYNPETLQIDSIDIRYDVITIRPNANGDTIQWTQYPGSGLNYDKVDEVTSDGDSTYIKTNVVNNIDLFQLSNPTPSGDITQIKVCILTKLDDGTYSNTIRIVIKTGGTIYESPDIATNATAYTDKNYTWTNNPNTGITWTWNDINNLQAGVKFISGSLGLRVTQIWVEITRTIPTTQYKNLEFQTIGLLKTFKNLEFALAKGIANTKNTEFNLEQEQKYSPPKVLINDVDVNDKINEIKFNDIKDGFSNTCTFKTKILKEQPSWLNIGRNTIEVKYSNKSTLFYGYFDYYENKERKPVGDTYSAECYNWLNSFKDIYITERYEEKDGGYILQQLINKYTTGFYVDNIDYTYTNLSLIYVNQPLFQAIQDICYLTRFSFWITSGKRVFFKYLDNRPALVTGIKTSDLNYIGNNPDVNYDLSNIKNKLKIRGGLKLSQTQHWQHTVVAADTNIFKIYPEKIYNIMVKVNGNILTIGEKGKDDENASIQVLFDTATYEFTFKTRPANGDIIDIYYYFAYRPVYSLTNDESINIWGLREAGIIEVPNIVDLNTAKNYAEAYMLQYAQPKLSGTIEIDMHKYPEVIHGGDIISVDLERFYTGNLYIDEVIYYINNTKFRATLNLRKQKDLFTILKTAFDLIFSMREKLRALEEKDQVIEREINYTSTLSISDSVQKTKSNQRFRFTDNLTIGRFQVEDDNYAY